MVRRMRWGGRSERAPGRGGRRRRGGMVYIVRGVTGVVFGDGETLGDVVEVGGWRIGCSESDACRLLWCRSRSIVVCAFRCVADWWWLGIVKLKLR
jgi:hypothetical protein